MERRPRPAASTSTTGSNPKVAKQIYDYLNKLGGQVGQFTNTLWKTGDGPFTLGSYNTTNNSFVLMPNKKYGGAPKPKNEVDVNTYTSFTSELNAVKSGGLDIMLGFDPSQIPQMSSLKSARILAYGGPGWGWFAGELNFKNTTNDFDKVIKQLYVRQALQYLINQPGYHQGCQQGRGGARLRSDPVCAELAVHAPRARRTPFVSVQPEEGRCAAEVSRLEGRSRTGTTTCAKPGTGKSQCGAGFPKGTPISHHPGEPA